MNLPVPKILDKNLDDEMRARLIDLGIRNIENDFSDDYFDKLKRVIIKEYEQKYLSQVFEELFIQNKSKKTQD